MERKGFITISLSSLVLLLCLDLSVNAQYGRGPLREPYDFLSENVPIYIVIILCLFAFQTVGLLLMGQSLISSSGTVRLWWGDIHSLENSQHITDWYTFTHILHGVIMFYLTFLTLPNPPITLHISFLLGLVTAVAWEIIENTPCVIARFRKTGASTMYSGDSVLNSFCDSIAMSAGFWLAYGLHRWWWVTLILALGEELILGLVIRDNMILNIVQVVYPFKCISDWQERGKRGSGAGTGGVTPVSQYADDDNVQDEE